MDTAEWDAMEARRKDGLVLTTLWKAENGKPIDIRWCESDDEIFYGEYIPSGKPWKTHEIEAKHVPWFVTDRNACALVLDEIADRGEVCDARFEKLLIEAMWGEGAKGYPCLLSALATDPDTICYAAVKAVSDEADLLS